ncbi:MAG: hypothetical protein ABIF19_08075 [Planctomycetota bacterium]
MAKTKKTGEEKYIERLESDRIHKAGDLLLDLTTWEYEDKWHTPAYKKKIKIVMSAMVKKFGMKAVLAELEGTVDLDAEGEGFSEEAIQPWADALGVPLERLRKK